MSDPRADALTALQVLAVEDSYALAIAAPGASGAPVTEPALDARLAKDWAVAGVVVGTDALWRKGCAATLLSDQTVFYGWLLRHLVAPGTFRCLIRGTASMIEWAEDAEGVPVSAPGLPGKVECGFYGIYASMRLRHPGSSVDMPLVAGITAIVGLGSLTIAGHSLGAPLSTYLASDLADQVRLGARVALRAYCSPRPGTTEYVEYAAALITDYASYANKLDVVTHVPFGLGYASLPATQTLWPVGKLRMDFLLAGDFLKSMHHVLSSAWLICSEAVDIASLPAIDKPFIDCLRLPKAAA